MPVGRIFVVGIHQTKKPMIFVSGILKKLTLSARETRLSVMFAVLALAGCQNVELEGIQPYSGTLPGYRLAPIGNITSMADVVEVTDYFDISYGDGTSLVDMAITGSNDCSSMKSWPGVGLPASLHLRVPVQLLAHVSEISISATKPGTPVVGPTLLGLCNANQSSLAIGTSASKSSDIGLLSMGKYTVRLVKDAPRFAFPGDEVLVTVSYQTGTQTTDEALTYFVTQTRATVSSDGMMAIPLLNAPNASADALSADWVGPSIVNNGFSLVRVWDSANQYGDEYRLQTLAACVLGWGAPGCNDSQIDPNVFAPGPRDVKRLRYRFEPMQHWAVTFEDGTRLEMPYRPGVTIVSAVEEAHERQFGRPLLSRSWSLTSGRYISVLPHTQSAERPFWAELNSGEKTDFDRVLLLPGDTIFVTYLKPQLQ